MDLDDQLSALAAGDLDPEEARAVRARVEADPALGRQLARHERLQALLTGWDVPEMTGRQRDALDAAVTDALDALDDGPLVDDGGARVIGLRPWAEDRDDRTAAAARGAASSSGDAVLDVSSGGVTDLGEARARRRGLPSWVSGLVAAAAAVAVVGTVGVGLSGIGGGDDAELADEAMIAADSAATGDDGADALDAAEEMAAEEMAEDAGDSAPLESAAADADAGGDDAADAAVPAVVVEPVVVEDLGSLDGSTVATVPAQVPPSVVETATGALTERTAVDDVLIEEAARVGDLVRGLLPPSECLDQSLAELTPTDVLVLVGRATFEGAPAVATVTVRRDGEAASTSPTLVTTIRDEATCGVVAELVTQP